MEMTEKEKIERSRNAPFLTFGKYKGKRVTQVPMSYLRWMSGQKFPEEIMEYVHEKLNSSKTSTVEIDITRHAYDSFSKRHIKWWEKYNEGLTDDLKTGIGTFLAELADRAWKEGKDVSLKRHQDEEIRKEYQGIKFVFNRDGDFRVLITIL